jgi:hypothetical protein
MGKSPPNVALPLVRVTLLAASPSQVTKPINPLGWQ